MPEYYRTKSQLAGREFSILFESYENSSDQTWWLATALEKAMVTHGPTKEEALRNLDHIAEVRVGFERKHGQRPFSSITSASSELWRRYNSPECKELPAE